MIVPNDDWGENKNEEKYNLIETSQVIKTITYLQLKNRFKEYFEFFNCILCMYLGMICICMYLRMICICMYLRTYTVKIHKKRIKYVHGKFKIYFLGLIMINLG